MHGLGIRVMGVQLDNRKDEFVRTLRFLEDTGFDSIELSTDDFDVIRTGELDVKITDTLKNILKTFHFRISVHVPLLLNLFNRDYPDLHLAVLERCLEFTDIIGADLLVYHPGRYVDNSEFSRIGKDKYSDSDKERLKKHEIKAVGSLSERFPGITIAFENLRSYIDHSPYSYAEYPQELARQVKAAGRKNVGMMIDTGHLMLAANYLGFDPLESVYSSGLFPVHFHINDNHGIPTYYTEKDKKGQLPFGRGDEHIAPGLGIFPFEKFLGSFQSFSGRYIIELTNRYFYRSKIEESYEFVMKILKNIRKKRDKAPADE